MTLSSVCEYSEVDGVSNEIHVLQELLKDGSGYHAHLASGVVLDADRDVSDVYSFNQGNGSFCVICGSNSLH